MDNSNYIQIQGWMVKELHLKGNELLIYALIYGFSQDGQSKFTGSLSYIADWISSSKQTVINTLKSLEEKNLIVKEQEVINNITFNKFSVVKNFDKGSQKIRQGVVKNFDLININNNNNNIKEKNIIKKEKFEKPDIEEVCDQYFVDTGCKNFNEEELHDFAERFINYYDSVGWKVGNHQMKDWRACVRTWIRNEKKYKNDKK